MSADDNKPKRVAIIGSGLAGLALAIALEKLPTGVETVKVSYSLGLRARDAIYRTDTCYAALKIFERTGQLRPNVGGGLQINGAVSVLSRYFQQTFNRLTMSLTRCTRDFLPNRARISPGCMMFSRTWQKDG